MLEFNLFLYKNIPNHLSGQLEEWNWTEHL